MTVKAIEIDTSEYEEHLRERIGEMNAAIHHGIGCFIIEFGRLPTRDEVSEIGDMALNALQARDCVATMTRH